MIRKDNTRQNKTIPFVPSSNSTNSLAVSSRSARRDCRRIEAQRVASVVGGGRVWATEVGDDDGGTISVMLLSCWGLEVVCGGRGEDGGWGLDWDSCAGTGLVVEVGFLEEWGLWALVWASVRECECEWEWEWECECEWEREWGWFADGILVGFCGSMVVRAVGRVWVCDEVDDGGGEGEGGS